jgi:pilus assembly protein Flp/PilA
MLKRWRRFSKGLMIYLRNERGSTAIEYALIAGFISIVIVGAATSIGSSITSNFYNEIGDALQ